LLPTLSCLSVSASLVSCLHHGCSVVYLSISPLHTTFRLPQLDSRPAVSKAILPLSGEEGGDDVKSARPLCPGLHTCYNGRYSGQLMREHLLISKTGLSTDRSLQPDSVKLDSLVIAHQPWCGEYVPGPCTHRPSSHGSWGYLKSVTFKEPPRVKLVTGAKS